jgi:hypothetical protein
MRSEIHCSQDPLFSSLISVFFKPGLVADHGLREVHLWVGATVPLCHFHQVYRFQSPRGFPPHVLSSCSPPSLPPRTRVRYSVRPTDVVSLQPVQSLAISCLKSPRLCPELHRPSAVPNADPWAVNSNSANFDWRLRHAAKRRTRTRLAVHSIRE